MATRFWLDPKLLECAVEWDGSFDCKAERSRG